MEQDQYIAGSVIRNIENHLGKQDHNTDLCDLMEEELFLDDYILAEIKDDYKTVRRICEDLTTIGIEANPSRVDVRLRSFRRAGMVDFKQIDTIAIGPKPIAYKLKEAFDKPKHI